MTRVERGDFVDSEAPSASPSSEADLAVSQATPQAGPDSVVEPVCSLDDEEDENPGTKLGCGVMARYPILSVIVMAGLGLAIGFAISTWTPENPQSKRDLIRWVGLVGDMFLRMLQAVVLPLVFVNISLASCDMLGMGKAKKVGFATIGLYMLTTFCAAAIGIITVMLFRPIFVVGDIPDSTDSKNDRFEIICTSGTYMTQLANGTLACLPYEQDASTGFTVAQQQFFLNDVDHAFENAQGSGPIDDLSLGDTIYEGVFLKLITNNVLQEFIDGNFAGVMVVAFAFGAAVYKTNLRLQHTQQAMMLISLFRELEKVLLLVINWILVFTPFAVLSLIASAVGEQDSLTDTMTNVGLLLVISLVAFVAHCILVYLGLFVLITRSNPLKFIKHLAPAQMMAFATASSAATIPVTQQCVIDTGLVPPTVARFVVPIGAGINMDGGSVYISVAIIMMATVSGLDVDVGQLILLAIIATIGSAGTAPVPSASLVLIITGYNTVFGTVGTPPALSYVLAIDWMVDRFRTVLNVTGDAVVARMVTHIAYVEEASPNDAFDEDPFEKESDLLKRGSPASVAKEMLTENPAVDSIA